MTLLGTFVLEGPFLCRNDVKPKEWEYQLIFGWLYTCANSFDWFVNRSHSPKREEWDIIVLKVQHFVKRKSYSWFWYVVCYGINVFILWKIWLNAKFVLLKLLLLCGLSFELHFEVTDLITNWMNYLSFSAIKLIILYLQT